MPASTPFFSIVTPTFNRSHMIARGIQSVISQDFTGWELIIIDDGSTDATREIVSSFADNRIRYLYQPNAGRSAARNKGIEQAAGKYICFLDSDDYYSASHLSGLSEKIRELNEPLALLYTGICFEKNGTVERRIELENTLDDVKEFVLKASIGTPQACVHSSILKEHRFNPLLHIGEDMELWLRIVDKYPLVHVNHYSIIAVEHDQRSVSTQNPDTYREQLRTLKAAFAPGQPGNQVRNRVKNEMLSNCYFGLAKGHMYTKNRFRAALYLVKSVLIDPCHAQTKHKLLTLLKMLFNRPTEYA